MGLQVKCVLIPGFSPLAGCLSHSAGPLKPPEPFLSLAISLSLSLSLSLPLSLSLSPPCVRLSLICPKLKARLHSRNLPACGLLIGLEQGHSTDLVQEAAFEAGWDTYIDTHNTQTLGHTHTHTHTQTIPLPLPCCDEGARVRLSPALLERLLY